MTDIVSSSLVVQPRRQSRPWWSRSRPLQRFRRNKVAVTALAFLLVMCVVAVCAPVLTPKDPNAQALRERLQGPSWAHLLGTDTLGRDVLSRLIMATRVTMLAVVQATLIALVLAVPTGAAAGYFGRWIDAVLSRIADAVLSLPPLILAVAIVGVAGPGLTNAMVAIGVVVSPTLFRVAKAAAQTVSTETYIEACKSFGCRPVRLLWRHVLPNAASPLIVELSFVAGVVIVAESTLSFLGLGVTPPDASWGSMLREAYREVYNSPWYMLPTGVIATVTILCFFTLGDGLRDALGGRSDR